MLPVTPKLRGYLKSLGQSRIVDSTLFFYVCTMNKSLLDKIPKRLKNFYVLITLAFLAWLAFFDTHDLISQFRLTAKQSELEEAKAFYESKIIEVQENRKNLLSDEALLEKVAREKYFMKRDGEEVFVVVEE